MPPAVHRTAVGGRPAGRTPFQVTAPFRARGHGPCGERTAQAAVAIASRHTPRSRSSSANSRRDHDRRPSTYRRISSLACAADTEADDAEDIGAVIEAATGAVTAPSAGTDIRRAGAASGTDAATEAAMGTGTATGTGTAMGAGTEPGTGTATGRDTGADTHAAAAAEEHELTMNQGYAGGLTTRPATARPRPGARP